MPLPSAPRHSCECVCSTCETQGAGYFAQRAALAGDPQAAERLSNEVFVTLATERGRRRRSLRKAPDQSSAQQKEKETHGAH